MVAYPALEEGFGLPALEALACGVPLVTTEGTAMAEVAGGAALLVPPGDAGALAGALRAALDEGRRDGTTGSGNRGRGGADVGGECGAARARVRGGSVGLAVGFRAMRALITGGKGFVGQWLGAHLKDRGDDVTVIDIETDVADGAAIRRVMADVVPDAVYHLAAMTHVGESWENPSQVLRVNVLGTAEILAAGRSLPVSPRVLVVSSAEVYGVVAPEQLPLGEDTPTAPASPYAASKLAAEVVALQAWRGYGQPVIVVRPFNHIGPGQSPNFFVPALAKRIVEARRSGATSLRVGTLTTRRDFTDVRDVVTAYRLLMEMGAPGEVYNVCSGRDVAMSEVAAQLLELAGTRPDPRDGSRPGASGRRPGAPGRRVPAACRHRVAAGHPTRDDARRRPGLLGGGLRASVVDVRGARGAQALTRWRIWVRTSRACSRALRGQLRDRGGQLLLERLQGRLDEVRGRLGQVVDLLEPLGHAVAHLVDALVQREILGQPVLQLDPPHLGPLVAQHAEADGNVGGVAGQVGDALGEGADVGGYVGHGRALLSARLTSEDGHAGGGRPTSAYVYKSITFVKQ